jgi:phytoene dehydrogenase-like protein
MVNVPANEGQDWDTIIEETRKNTIAKLSRLLGVDFKACIANESILDPRSIESKTSSFRGALYGSSSNHMMSAFFRHANFSGSIEGLYFCGGSVHPGGGIPLCLLSAKIVSGLVKA